MAEASKSLGSVQFGPFELLLDTQELRKHGLPDKLSGQAIQILIDLATRPGQLVTREELQRKLWPTDSYGDFEHGLNAAVNKLREKLRDSATTPTYVETLPGNVASPTFSPDGSQIAFAWNGENNGAGFDLYVKAIGIEKPLRLT